MSGSETLRQGSSQSLNVRERREIHLRELLSSCPQAGGGVHSWIWHAAMKLHTDYEPRTIKKLLTLATRNCGRDTKREIDDAIRNSAPSLRSSGPERTCLAEQNHRTALTKLPIVKVCERRRRSVVAEGLVLNDLRAASPVRLPNEGRAQAQVAPRVLDTLYPGDPLLCLAPDSFTRVTAPKAAHLKTCLLGMQFIIPNPMCASAGVTRDGKKSRGCLGNTGPRRFLVVEFDLQAGTNDVGPTADVELLRWAQAGGRSTQDICAALLWHLQRFAPLAMVVDSAGKSLHGWFYVEGWPEEQVRKFMTVAVGLGADPHTFTKSQLVRMPGGSRDRKGDTTKLLFQEVPYFDPDAMSAASNSPL